MDRLLAGLDVSGSGTNSKLTIDIPADAVSVSFYYSYPKTLLVSQGDQFHIGWVSGTDTDIKQYEAGLDGLEETCAKDCLEIPGKQKLVSPSFGSKSIATCDTKVSSSILKYKPTYPPPRLFTCVRYT